MSDEQLIETIHRRWILAKLSGEIESLLALCSEDVRFKPPGKEPIEGRSDVEAYLRGSDEFVVEIHSDDVAIEVSGHDAKKTARFTARLSNGRTERRVRGRHLWALRKTENQWAISEMGWTVDEDDALK